MHSHAGEAVKVFEKSEDNRGEWGRNPFPQNCERAEGQIFPGDFQTSKAKETETNPHLVPLACTEKGSTDLSAPTIPNAIRTNMIKCYKPDTD